MEGFHAQRFLLDIFFTAAQSPLPSAFSTLVITSENSQNFVNSLPFLSASLLEGQWGCGFWVERYNMQDRSVTPANFPLHLSPGVCFLRNLLKTMAPVAPGTKFRIQLPCSFKGPYHECCKHFFF